MNQSNMNAKTVTWPGGEEFAPWPYFEDDEIEAVERVLNSGKVNQWTSSEVAAFEEDFAHYLGVEHSIALSNGSLALDLAMITLGIGPGDEVIVTPRTFMASAGCIALRGATPVFVDIDPDSQDITLETVKNAWTPATRAVIAVHLAGWPCAIEALRQFCDEKGMYLIEDCAQAHGACCNGQAVGSFGDLAAFSFCQDKIMTTGGEGGMLVTNNSDLWKKAWAYKDHGKDYYAVFNSEHPAGFRWLVKSFGTNYRMTAMQAAIGRRQLAKLDGWVEKRRENASILTEGFSDVKALRITVPDSNIYHSYYKYYAFIRPEMLDDGWNRDRIVRELVERGVPCSMGSCSEVYRESAFAGGKYRLGMKHACPVVDRLPVARALGETSLMFLVHPTLNKSNMHYVVDQVKSVMAEAAR